MKKTLFYSTFFLIITVLFTTNVFAAKSTCTYSTKQVLTKTAHNMSFDYVPVETIVEGAVSLEEPDLPLYQYGFDLGIYNITSDLYVLVSNNIDSTTEKITFEKAIDGKYVYNVVYTGEVVTYKFEVFGNSEGCNEVSIRTSYVTTPLRNEYAEIGACEEVPDFYLCQKYVTKNVDYETFSKKLESYKTKIKEEKEQATEKEHPILSFVNNYKYIIVSLIIISGGVTIFIVIKKKRSRII